jgi:hypothetical protein
MNKTILTKEERKSRLLRDKKRAWLVIFIGLLAFIAFVYSGRQYNRTIIPFIYVLSGSLVTGLAIGTIRLKYSQVTNRKRSDIWQQRLWVSVVYGSLICALFFWTNIHFSKSDSHQTKYPILARFETYRYHLLYVAINFNGIQKEIPVPNSDETEIKKSNFLILTFKNGFWGFPFIVDEKLSIN